MTRVVLRILRAGWESTVRPYDYVQFIADSKESLIYSRPTQAWRLASFGIRVATFPIPLLRRRSKLLAHSSLIQRGPETDDAIASNVSSNLRNASFIRRTSKETKIEARAAPLLRRNAGPPYVDL